MYSDERENSKCVVVSVSHSSTVRIYIFRIYFRYIYFSLIFFFAHIILNFFLSLIHSRCCCCSTTNFIFADNFLTVALSRLLLMLIVYMRKISQKFSPSSMIFHERLFGCICLSRFFQLSMIVRCVMHWYLYDYVVYIKDYLHRILLPSFSYFSFLSFVSFHVSFGMAFLPQS